MQKMIFILLGMISFIIPFYSFALVPDPVPCVRDLELTFFRTDLVFQALSLYDIPQGLWDPISGDLKIRSRQVLDRMKKKTARMVPNPIEYPLQRIPTAKILLNVLHEVYLETMVYYQVNEQPTADLIFDYIFAKQGKRFEECFGPEVKELLPKTY